MRHDPDPWLLTRLEAARETLAGEHGAEHAYYRGEFIEELHEHVLEIGFALLEADERIEGHVRKHRRPA